MDVPGHVAEIGGDVPLDQGAVDLPPLVVHLLHHPDTARDGDFIPHGRRLDNGAQLLGAGPDRVLHVLLEHGVELVVVHNALPCKAHHQAAVFRAVDVVVFQQVAEQDAVVLLGDAVEAGQGQYPAGQLPGGHLPAGGQGAHGLVVQQAVGQTAGAGRLHKALLDVQLHQGDALYQPPGNHIRQHGPGLGVVLPHDEPHLRGLAPAAGAAHALQKARHGKGRVQLEGPLQPADVDAQLQGGGGADGQQRAVVLHLLLGALPVGGGEVPVVDEEAVGLVVYFAVLAQALADGLALLPGVGEDEALLAPGVLEDVANARVRRFGCGVGGLLQDGERLDDGLALVGLGVGVEEVLHGEAPDLPAALALGDDGGPAAARRQKAPGGLGVADGGGEAHPPGMAPRRLAEALDEAEGLHAPVPPQQGVYLIDDHKAQIPKEGGDFHALVDEQGFQGLRRNLQNAPGLAQQAALLGLGHVPVPAGDGNAGLLAQLREPAELVVDKGL